MSSLLGMLPSVLMIVSPILITACGGMICERSGVVNIALEGLMGIGAFAAASFHVLNEVALGGASVWLALLVGAIAGISSNSASNIQINTGKEYLTDNRENLPETGTVTYNVKIQESGFYNIKIKYYTIIDICSRIFKFQEHVIHIIC